MAEHINPESAVDIPCHSKYGASELHLLEYKQRMLEYLNHFRTRRVNLFRANIDRLLGFSSPSDVDGYGDKCISNDLITDLLLEFSERTRKIESTEYLQTLSGKQPFRHYPATNS